MYLLLLPDFGWPTKTNQKFSIIGLRLYDVYRAWQDAITYWPVLIISESKPRHSSMRCFFCATASESMYKWARLRESGTGRCEMANCYTWIPLVSLDSWQGYDLQRIFSTSWVLTGVYLPCSVSKFQVAFSRSCWFYTYLPFKPGKRERERFMAH